MCRRHLISPAWIRRGKTRCQMGWNTWRSWLVKTGEGNLGPQRANWWETRGQEEIFFYEYENHTTGQEPDAPASLRGPGEQFPANTFLSFFKVRPKVKNTSSWKLSWFLLAGTYSSFISCIFSFYYIWLSWYYIDLYSLIWSFLTAVPLLHLVQFRLSKQYKLLKGKGYSFLFPASVHQAWTCALRRTGSQKCPAQMTAPIPWPWSSVVYKSCLHSVPSALITVRKFFLT